MKFLKVWLSCCLVLLGLAGTAQQNKTLNAIVLTDNGSPIAGASILLKKTGKGTSTNQDGKFTISYSASDTLIVSSLNYTSKQVHLHGQTNLQITLQEKSQQVDEVVVVGYGTQRKATLTGSVTQINADEINESKSPNIANSYAWTCGQ